MLNEEPVQSQDLQMMGMLLPLGIEKGKAFKPDVATVARLNSAAAEAHAWLLAQIPTFVADVQRTPGPNGPICSARLQCSERGGQGQTETIANLIIRPRGVPLTFSSLMLDRHDWAID